VGTPGDIQLVALRGNAAPGAGGSTFDYIDRIALNNSGQAALTAYLNDGRIGIWAQDKLGILHLIAMDGELLEFAPGDMRTIAGVSALGSYGNNDGSPIMFNDRGQIVFSANFTDGTSGVFVSNLVAVPEPSALVLMAMAVASNFVRRSR
jgi:hypothetical protein